MSVQSNQISRRTFLQWAGVGAAGAALVACAPAVAPAPSTATGGGAAAPSQATTTVGYWLIGGQQWDDFYNKTIFPVFYEKHPEIKMETTIHRQLDRPVQQASYFRRRRRAARVGAPEGLLHARLCRARHFAGTRRLCRHLRPYHRRRLSAAGVDEFALGRQDSRHAAAYLHPLPAHEHGLVHRRRPGER